MGIALGAIADVWEGTYRSKKVSVKCLRIHTKNYQTLKKVRIGTAHLTAFTQERLWVLQSFSKEAVVWKRLKHPNIVPFIGVTTDPLQIISEWMPNGTLTEFIERSPDASRIDLVSSSL